MTLHKASLVLVAAIAALAGASAVDGASAAGFMGGGLYRTPQPSQVLPVDLPFFI
jgi:hypothetical protein